MQTSKKNLIDRIIRVDHAGEYGAQRIYEGQMRALKDSDVYETIKEMHEQEKKHLNFFENEMRIRKVRPTVMFPFWHIGGYAMGFVTGIMGKKAAMACTVAVEEVIGEHYEGQENALALYKDEQQLTETIKEFKEEELEHKEIGEEHDAGDAPFYPFIYSAVRTITKLAVKISERI